MGDLVAGADKPLRLWLESRPSVRVGLAEAAELVEDWATADLVIVEPSELAPEQVAARIATAGDDGPARFLWLVAGVREAEAFLPLADRFDYVFAAELDVAAELTRRLGPGRVGLAPLAGRTRTDAGLSDPRGGIEHDPSSETRLNPDLLDQLISAGRAACPYDRATWNFLGLVPSAGREIMAEPEAVASEHSWSARLAQMVLQANGGQPTGQAWAAAVGEVTMSESGMEIVPEAWPEAERQVDGGYLRARQVDGGLNWEVEPGKTTNFSLTLRGSLPVDQVSSEGRIYVRLEGSGPLDGQVCVVLADRFGRPVEASWMSWNVLNCVVVPAQASRLRLAIRALGSGRARFTALRLASHDQHWALPLRSARDRLLVLSDSYPSYGNIYSFGFVHSRVRAYQKLGLDVDVMVVRPSAPKTWREYDGVQVLEGSAGLLEQLLESERYNAVAVHFLKPHLWETLAPFTGRLPLTIWVHGADIQPWWRRGHLIDSPEKQAWFEDHTERLMKMWRPVLAAGTDQAPVRFVFVSKTFAGEVAADLTALGMELSAGRVNVIPNPVDTELFAYQPKDVEQRKRILMIRSFGTRKYGTDLASAAIRELSSSPVFDDLEFLIVGDGDLWEEDMGPLARFANVKFDRRFITHDEIAVLQRDYGVMLQPTRWDSQGVSRDEAMASGLVVISNATAAVPEFLSEAEGYLAGPEDSHGIARAVEHLYHHPEVFARKSAAAAARVRSTLNSVELARQEIALLKEGTLVR
ncbi:MAG: glycosyltransferase [Bifidobacteriaceae bacterium]|nr:glycosyltransferase [Bifidobacteriaceae bacterium]